jgi:ketosteroid isomerase-like protein
VSSTKERTEIALTCTEALMHRSSRRGSGPASILLTVVLSACAAQGEADPATRRSTEQDVAAVRALEDAYVAGWLANDAAAVLATLADSASIIPGGMEAITGADAIADYWWPSGGPATTVTGYASTIDDIGVAGSLAYVRGTGDLSFSLEGPAGGRTEHRSRSIFLMVARKGAGGDWRMQQRMWAPLPPTE